MSDSTVEGKNYNNAGEAVALSYFNRDPTAVTKAESFVKLEVLSHLETGQTHGARKRDFLRACHDADNRTISYRFSILISCSFLSISWTDSDNLDI